MNKSLEFNFLSYNNPPKLVEKELKKFYVNKIKVNNLKQQIYNESNEWTIINNLKYYLKNILNVIIEFIKEYYGFVLLLTAIIILLYVRYIEIHKRKKKIKKILNKYDLDDSDDDN